MTWPNEYASSTQADGVSQHGRIYFLWLGTPFLLAAVIFIGSAWSDGSFAAELARELGTLCLLACIVGRCWCALHIGGRKNLTLVTSGPYRLSRNPLYLFSTIGLSGLGLMLGSYVIAVALFAFGFLTFHFMTKREEEVLRQQFGAEYASYCSGVPAFFPRFQWHLLKSHDTAPEREYSPRALQRTFWDAFAFCLFLPLSEAIEFLHDGGLVQPLLRLY